MRRIVDLNVEESILKNRLVCKTEWYDLPSQLTIYFSAFIFTLFLINVISEIDYGNLHDRVFKLLPSSLISLVALFIAYRKATEKYFLKIKTPFNTAQTKTILIKYIRSKGYKTYLHGKSYMIFNKSATGELASDEKLESAIFIVKDNLILFTTLEEHFKINWPTFFSHLKLKHELEEACNNFNVNTYEVSKTS